MDKFYQDLEFGKKFELECLKFFKYEKVEIKKGNFKGYDILLDDKLKVEVKAEKLAYITGNLAIEYECSGVGSGINSTECDFWVHFVVNPKNYADYKVYQFKIDDLKKLVLQCRSVSGGDGNRAKMYLLPHRVLKEFLIN